MNPVCPTVTVFMLKLHQYAVFTCNVMMGFLFCFVSFTQYGIQVWGRLFGHCNIQVLAPRTKLILSTTTLRVTADGEGSCARPVTGYGARARSLWTHRNLFWHASKEQKLKPFRHVTHHNSLSKTTLQGTLEGRRHCSWQRKCLMDSIKKWISQPMLELLIMASCQKRLEEDLITQSVKGLNWVRDHELV